MVVRGGDCFAQNCFSLETIQRKIMHRFSILNMSRHGQLSYHASDLRPREVTCDSTAWGTTRRPGYLGLYAGADAAIYQATLHHLRAHRYSICTGGMSVCSCLRICRLRQGFSTLLVLCSYSSGLNLTQEHLNPAHLKFSATHSPYIQ